MSWDAMIAVMDGSVCRGAAFACLLAVAKSATEAGEWKTYLSVEEIAERARIEPRSARRGLRKCEAMGELHTNVMHGRQGVNLWRLETGVLMRQAAEKYPDRRYTIDGTGFTPDRTSGGRTDGPPTPDRRSATPDRRSVTPDRRSPGEGSRGILEGEGEGVRNPKRVDAADPPSGEVVGGAGSVMGGVSDPLRLKTVCPKGDPQAITWDEAMGTDAQWERACRNAGAQVHNGQGMEWAGIATDIGVITLEEAQWTVRAMVKMAKKEQPSRRQPWAVSECIGFKEDASRLLIQRRVHEYTKQSKAAP